MALPSSRRNAAQLGMPTPVRPKELEQLDVKTAKARCGLCGNNCLLTINRFGKDGRFISGNRCERGAGGEPNPRKLPNLYRERSDRLLPTLLCP